MDIIDPAHRSRPGTYGGHKVLLYNITYVIELCLSAKITYSNSKVKPFIELKVDICAGKDAKAAGACTIRFVAMVVESGFR